MAKKRNITGSVRPRPNKDNVRYYDVILELGTDPVTGKRNRVRFKSDSDSREDAENLLTIKKAEYLQGELLLPDKRTVEDFMNEYIDDYVRIQNSPATLRDYKTTIDRYIIPMFGKIKLQKLTQPIIQKVYNGWREKSNASNKPLKTETIHHINRIFKAALNVACELGYIKTNPTKNVKIGKDNKTDEIEVYTTEEIRALKKAVKGTDMELPVALLFDCVLRRGEILGLSFEDIDFEKKIVYVRHSWVESVDSTQPVLKDCKTNGSRRKMVVSDETIRLLKRQELFCKEICLGKGKKFTGKQRVVCKQDGEPFRPKSFTAKWADTLKKYNLRHMKLHGTRHSAISWLLSQGVPVHIVQARAGHKDPKITLSVYSHVAKGDENLVADLLDEKLFKKASNE